MAVLPGLKMRKARTEMAISVDQAAASLGLTERMLKALEADDYDKLPADVYVRGYIRNYCALLNIDAAAILQAFEQLVAAETKQIPEEQRQPLLEDPRLRVIIACTTAILLLLVAAAVIADSPDRPIQLVDLGRYGGAYVSSETPRLSILS